MQTFERTGQLVSITGLAGLETGRVYVVNSNDAGSLMLEELKDVKVIEKVSPFTVAGLSIDASARVARGPEGERHLTRTEWELLLFLVRNQNVMVRSNALVRELWHMEPDTTSRQYLRVWMSRLRKRLPELPVVTVAGEGYRLEVPA